jgi:DNA-binding CsgD family transcriptional regulator
LAGTDSDREVVSDALFGRAGELELIREFLDRGAAHGDALVVLGDPGVGKTALLRAAEAMASEAGRRVLTAAGVESEADVTFSGLHEALFPLYDEISELTDPYRQALTVALGFGDGARPDRLRIANATLTLLAQAASSAPLLLTIDDLPWLDRPSAVVLSMVARRLRGSRVAMLGASRIGEESFFERAGLRTVALSPLDNEAAGDLMSAHFPTLAPAVRARLLAEAEGNPLAVLELPAALRDRERAALGALPAVLPLPRRLQGLFQSRVASLPDRSRWLLLLVALDRTGDVRMFEPDGDSGPVLDDLPPAEEAGLAFMDLTARRVMFRHPMIRSAVVESSTVVERREAHQRLAELWADQPDRQVWHLAEATVHEDERVAALLERAGRRVLRRGDGVGAVTTLIRAAGLSPTPSERARRMALAAYIGADVTGQLQDASRLLADAHALDAGLGGSLQAATTAALLLLNAEGDVETAHQLLAGAIADWVPGNDEPDVLWEALNTLLMVCHFGGRPELFVSFDREFDRLGADAPTILRVSGRILADPARKAAAVLPDLDAIVGRLTAEEDPAHIVRTALPCGFVGRLGACREPLNRLVRESSERGTETVAIQALSMLGHDSFLSGEWDVAARQADEARELCRIRGFHLSGAWSSRYIQALLAAGRGEYETVGSIVAEMVQWAMPRGVRYVQWCAWHARTLAALSQGDFDEAFRRASAISPAGTFASHGYYALYVPMDLVEAAVRSGRHDEAAAHVTAMHELNIAGLGSRLALLVAGSAAMASPADGGLELFEDALALSDTDRWPFDRARVALAYGERLRRARAMTEARSHLRSALETFERLGAKPWVARASGELRATGQTRARGDASNQSALTPQEFEIATLAASGLSNNEIAGRMFLSPRTVAAHLYRVFPKLGVTSRAGLRDALNSLPLERKPRSLN